MPLRLLVVDDNQRFLDVARRSLERQGSAAVRTAATIDGALDEVAAEVPDAVLVDVSLGAESGFELLRRLVARFPQLTGRVVMISTRAEEDYTELMEGVPAAGFLAKSALSVTAIELLIGAQG